MYRVATILKNARERKKIERKRGEKWWKEKGRERDIEKKRELIVLRNSVTDL